MRRSFLQILAIGAIFLLLGVAGGAGFLALLPNTASEPSIYDDFNWDSTVSNFWHVNAVGGSARIKNGILTISGHSVELDRRMQTDPYRTVVVARVRGQRWNKFAVGLGLYHSGTIAIEFDRDGIKCGRGTDHGWKIDFVKGWSTPPTDKWYYLEVSVKNPYPNVKTFTPKMKTPVTVTCSVYDAQRRLVGSVDAVDPPPNTHYVALDEAYVRIWDSHNSYDVDWFYAGPPSGIPAGSVTQ